MPKHGNHNTLTKKDRSMGIMCSYRLWVLGEEAKHVVDQVVDDGWTLVSQSEMGAEFECEGNYLLRGSPILRDYPQLVVVMSADHDEGMGFHHLLSVEQCGHFVSRFWPHDEERDEELDAIENDGFALDNLMTEAIYEHGIHEGIERVRRAPVRYGESVTLSEDQVVEALLLRGIDNDLLNEVVVQMGPNVANWWWEYYQPCDPAPYIPLTDSHLIRSLYAWGVRGRLLHKVCESIGAEFFDCFVAMRQQLYSETIRGLLKLGIGGKSLIAICMGTGEECYQSLLSMIESPEDTLTPNEYGALCLALNGGDDPVADLWNRIQPLAAEE